MLDSLPNNLIAYIFEFLDLRSFSPISGTCTKFLRIINDHRKFWARECLNRYLSFELEAYSEIYDIQDYKSYIQRKVLTSQNQSYKQLLIDGENYKQNFIQILSKLGSEERVDAFTIYFFETLRQPLLPLANLKRETILCNAQTIFQNKLSEVLYEDSGMVVKKLSFLNENEEFINELKNFDELLVQESASCDKDSLVKARWYAFESNDNLSKIANANGEKCHSFKGLPNFQIGTMSLDSTNDEVQSTKTTSFWLLDLYNCICANIIHFCGIISKHLNSLDNTYDLLAEYTSRWNTYVSTMLEFEQTFKAFSELMNKSYEFVFKDYPAFPKFSFWRLMSKIWLQEVYENSNLNRSLNEAFLRVLGSHREKNMQESLNVNFCNIRPEENGEELPKFLFVSLKTKDKKKSTIQYQSAEQLHNFKPDCLTDLEETDKKLLSNFLQSVLDISLTEVSIHYIDCTETNVNYPYRETEQAFLLKSNEFYNEYQPLFAESPDYFCQFLKADCALISEIIPQRTYIKLETIQIQNGFQSIKEFVRNQLSKLDVASLEKCEKESALFNDHANDITEFTQNFLSEILEEQTSAPQQPQCRDFYNLPPLELELEGLEEETSENCEEEKKEQDSLLCYYPDKKVLVKKLSKFFEATHQNFVLNFEYLYQRLQEFEQIREKDKQIKDFNTEKNIPFEMGDVDRLFYDLDKNIDISLLQKLSEDYNNFCSEEGKNNSKGMDLPSLEEVMGPGADGNGFQDLGFDPNMMDFSDLDLFNLENPTLRRAPI